MEFEAKIQFLHVCNLSYTPPPKKKRERENDANTALQKCED